MDKIDDAEPSLTHYKIGNREIGFHLVRGHGVLSDGVGIYKGAGSAARRVTVHR